MLKQAVGTIETVGLVAAMEAADVACKTANVELVGYQLSRGGGMVTVKILGQVSAVQSAIRAAESAAQLVHKVYSTSIIPRPHPSLEALIDNPNTVGSPAAAKAKVKPAAAKSAPAPEKTPAAAAPKTTAAKSSSTKSAAKPAAKTTKASSTKSTTAKSEPTAKPEPESKPAASSKATKAEPSGTKTAAQPKSTQKGNDK